MVVKQFTEILAREKRELLLTFQERKRARHIEWGWPRKWEAGVESFIEFQKATCRHRGWSGASQVALVVKETHLPIQET